MTLAFRLSILWLPLTKRAHEIPQRQDRLLYCWNREVERTTTGESVEHYDIYHLIGKPTLTFHQ